MVDVSTVRKDEELHGYICPGLIQDFRMSEVIMKKLGSMVEEVLRLKFAGGLVAVVVGGGILVGFEYPVLGAG